MSVALRAGVQGEVANCYPALHSRKFTSIRGSDLHLVVALPRRVDSCVFAVGPSNLRLLRGYKNLDAKALGPRDASRGGNLLECLCL